MFPNCRQTGNNPCADNPNSVSYCLKRGLRQLDAADRRAAANFPQTGLFGNMHFHEPPVRLKFLAVRDTLIRTVLVTIASVLLVTGCKEQLESHYPTVNAAAHAGAFERGWLPGVLQPDATDIREWHDLDSDEVRGGSRSMIRFCIACNPIAKSRQR